MVYFNCNYKFKTKVPINRLEVNWKKWAAAKSLTETQQHTPVAYGGGGGPALRWRRSLRCLNCMQLRCRLMSEFIDKFIDMLKWYCLLHEKRWAAQWPARRRLKTFLFLQILPTVAFLCFFGAGSTDSPQTVYRYFWAYPFFTFSFFLFFFSSLFSCWFRAVD